MREGWTTKQLGDLCTIRPPKKEARARLNDNTEVGFLPMEDLGVRQQAVTTTQTKSLGEVYKGYTYFADGDVLLAKITPCFQNGKLGIARNLPNGVGFGSSEYFVLRSNGEILPEYLFYFLSQDSFTEGGIRQMSGAVGHQRVPPEYVASQEIPLPPLAEQKRIVAALDEAFEAIERAEEVTQRRVAALDALLPTLTADTLQSDGSGWPRVAVGDIITLQRGFDITKKQQKPGTVPVVSSGGTKSFHSEAMATGPGVVVGRKGSIGTVHYITDDYWPHDTTLWVKDFKGNHPRFVFHLLRSLPLTSLDSGTANPALNRNLVHPLRASLPSVDEQIALARRIDDTLAQIDDLRALSVRKLCALNDLRSSLLAAAFGGGLTTRPKPKLVHA